MPSLMAFITPMLLEGEQKRRKKKNLPPPHHHHVRAHFTCGLRFGEKPRLCFMGGLVEAFCCPLFACCIQPALDFTCTK